MWLWVRNKKMDCKDWRDQHFENIVGQDVKLKGKGPVKKVDVVCESYKNTKGCVNGGNIKLYKNKTLLEC